MPKLKWHPFLYVYISCIVLLHQTTTLSNNTSQRSIKGNDVIILDFFNKVTFATCRIIINENDLCQEI